MCEKFNNSSVYVDDIRYDKFEQRTLLKYGNGTQTDYTYNPLNRLMNTLKVQKGSTVLMNNAYTYDAVQNITGIVSSNITQGAIGGSMSHQYRYDNLNRLDSAWGSFVGPNSKMADYRLGLSYDNMHNITRKTQDIVQQNLKFNGILNSGYNLSYTYANNSQQIANIADASYRADRSGGAYGTGRQHTDVLNEKAQSFTYDANGNMTYVATGKKLNDSTLQATNTRKLLWDEENRLLGISDNGYVSNYWYDAAGERTVKQSGGSEGVFVNGVLSGARTETGKFTAYVSPYLVVSNGGNYTKHIYMGSQRITSKVSNSGIFTSRNPLTDTTALNKSYTAKFTSLTDKIKERFDSLGVIYNGSPQTGSLISVNPASTASEYFYHSDHLGSSSLITDGTGALVQHIEYVPFGETFIDERNGSWSTPYLFNGKEKDEETGLYYYSARYYDSRLGVWLSVDPLANYDPINNEQNYLDGEHNGGVFNPRNLNVYGYCYQNPIRYVDPNGKQSDVVLPNKPANLDLNVWEKYNPTNLPAAGGHTAYWRHKESGVFLAFDEEGSHYHLYENSRFNRRLDADGNISGSKLQNGAKLSRGGTRFHLKGGTKLNITAISRTIQKSLGTLGLISFFSDIFKIATNHPDALFSTINPNGKINTLYGITTAENPFQNLYYEIKEKNKDGSISVIFYRSYYYDYNSGCFRGTGEYKNGVMIKDNNGNYKFNETI